MKILEIKNMIPAKKLAVILLVTSVISSCTKTEDITDSLIKSGGFIRFEGNAPPTTVGVNAIQDLKYDFTLIDAQDNIKSFEISLTANLSGTQTDTILIETVTSFPATFSFNSESLAKVINKTTDDISFGDNFSFLGKAVTNDGLEYSYERLDFDKSDDDPPVYTLRGGGLSDDIFDEPGYKQAYDFGFVILCPSGEADKLTGTFNVTRHLFDAYFGSQGTTREVVLGPGENEITIIGGALPLDGAEDLILKIDPASSVVSYGGEEGKIHFNTFGPGSYASVKGYVFSCIGVIQIEILSDGFIPNFLTLKKQ